MDPNSYAAILILLALLALLNLVASSSNKGDNSKVQLIIAELGVYILVMIGNVMFDLNWLRWVSSLAGIWVYLHLHLFKRRTVYAEYKNTSAKYSKILRSLRPFNEMAFSMVGLLFATYYLVAHIAHTLDFNLYTFKSASILMVVSAIVSWYGSWNISKEMNIRNTLNVYNGIAIVAWVLLLSSPVGSFMVLAFTMLVIIGSFELKLVVKGITRYQNSNSLMNWEKSRAVLNTIECFIVPIMAKILTTFTITGWYAIKFVIIFIAEHLV
ncbi:MAG: hypothetical protein ACOCXQ_03685 [Patescibacteria group bacterium]